MDKKEIKGYIFDYGGTLDTAGCHWGKMLWHAYERHHIPISERQFRDAYVYAERTLGTNPIIQTSYSFYKTLQVKVRIEMEFLGANEYWNPEKNDLEMSINSVVNDLYGLVKNITSHSRDTLLTIKKDFPTILVSNFYGNINVVLKEFGFNDIFKNVVESAVVGVRKPDPRIFQMGVEALGLKPEEVVVVGDSFKKDIIPAKKAGCHVIWFKGEAWEPEINDESLCDKIITDLSQLL